ncbi:MAG TPA: proteasome accessory factor PafA2 family protein [Propionibacteriaceae bacterium]|nr:proteasome accessory factor PafA2 family protein [Propionibacteriaceae bacterium]
MGRRVHGLETEYGLIVATETPQGWRRVGNDEAARILFGPVVEENASTSVFLRNGGRLYLDVGSHPEYATAECDRLVDLVAQDAAGDRILTSLARRASEQLASERVTVRISLFKNNVDSHGNAWGSHENYQVPRALDLGSWEALTPFLVTRSLVTGAGRWTPAGFQLSQRADHLWDPLSSTTTRSRPMINTRDEPHADPLLFRRLHVISGDSSLSETTVLMKFGMTDLVLAAIEDGHDFAAWALADPTTAVRLVSRDVRGRVRLELARGGVASPLDVQRGFHAVAGQYVGDDPELARVHELWGRALEAVADDRLDRIERWVDWATKLRVIDGLAERGAGPGKLAQADIAHHDLADGLFARLASTGHVDRVVDEDAVSRAVEAAPATTRAVLRSRLVTAAQRFQRSYGVDWMTFTCHDLPDGVVICPDPLAAEDPRVDALIERMANEPRRPGSAVFAG